MKKCRWSGSSYVLLPFDSLFLLVQILTKCKLLKNIAKGLKLSSEIDGAEKRSRNSSGTLKKLCVGSVQRR